MVFEKSKLGLGDWTNISTIDDRQPIGNRFYKGNLCIYSPMNKFANNDGATRSSQQKNK